MFTITTNNSELTFKDYATALGMYYTLIGNSILNKETHAYFDFELNSVVLMETEVINGEIGKHYSALDRTL